MHVKVVNMVNYGIFNTMKCEFEYVNMSKSRFFFHLFCLGFMVPTVSEDSCLVLVLGKKMSLLHSPYFLFMELLLSVC